MKGKPCLYITYIYKIEKFNFKVKRATAFHSELVARAANTCEKENAKS